MIDAVYLAVCGTVWPILNPILHFQCFCEPLECFSKKCEISKKPLKKPLSRLWKYIFASGGSFSILCVWQNVLCDFWQATTAGTVFDYFQKRPSVRTPEKPSKNWHCKPVILPLYQRQGQKALIFQQYGPSRPPREQTRRISRFKKIAGRGHNFSTTLKHRILIFAELKSEIIKNLRAPWDTFCQ